MNSKDKGNIGEAVVLAQFVKRNIAVSIPFGDNTRYDLIAQFKGKLNKIQIKYCHQKISKAGSISCPCSSSLNHTTNKVRTTYENEIDYFAFYLAEWNKVILVPMEIIGSKKTIAFRLDAPKNNQEKCNIVSDYEFDKILI